MLSEGQHEGSTSPSERQQWPYWESRMMWDELPEENDICQGLARHQR